MALSKVNLVRLKSGVAPSDGSVVTYDADSALYNHQTQASFATEVAPKIDLSAADNSTAGFVNDDNIPLKAISIDGAIIPTNNRVADIGDNLLQPSDVSNGAYSQFYVSVSSPHPTSGKDGDLWFVIG
jgi:hypothetical protein|tara:strand:+ start:310 stop:693 length:384 start_codon:yes stop_codon:yes gene_type:complete